MTIPSFQVYFNPLLQMMSDEKVRHISEIEADLGRHFRLTQSELDEYVPSGNVTRHGDRVRWAATYLKQAALLIQPQRAHYQISQQGIVVARSNELVDTEYLTRFPEFQAFRKRSKSQNSARQEDHVRAISLVEPHDATPDETLLAGLDALQSNLAGELLERAKSASPAFFEQLVLDLLVSMGYGGSRVEASQRVGRSGDDGVDGVINEDRLGLDVIYVQAKRWQGSVGPAVVREFSGSLDMHGASKGVLITTGTFSREAEETAKRLSKRIVLIDGERLTQLMIEFNIGVSVRDKVEIKKIDEDYFSGE